MRYGYDENNLYTGVITCQPNPMVPGEFLAPARTTDVAPPEPNHPKGTTAADQRASWNGTSWDEVLDPQIAIDLSNQKANDGSKVIVFYDAASKNVLSHGVKSEVWDYDADEAMLDGELVSTLAGVECAEIVGASNIASADGHGLLNQKIDDTDPEALVLVARTDAEYTDAVAEADLLVLKGADSMKIIVFYRTEAGKDKKVLSSAMKNSVWDYDNDEPLWNGAVASLDSDIDWAEFDDTYSVSFDVHNVITDVVDDTDPNNKVIAARSGADYDAEAEIAAMAMIRAERDGKLASTMWVWERQNHEEELAVSPMTLNATDYALWLDYWQELRDLPSTVSGAVAWLASPAWPSEPVYASV